MSVMRVEWFREPRDGEPRIAGTWTYCGGCGHRFDYWRKGEPPLDPDDPTNCPACGTRFTSRTDIVRDEVGV